jgi:hypothetical protein
MAALVVAEGIGGGTGTAARESTIALVVTGWLGTGRGICESSSSTVLNGFMRMSRLALAITPAHHVEASERSKKRKCQHIFVFLTCWALSAASLQATDKPQRGQVSGACRLVFCG